MSRNGAQTDQLFLCNKVSYNQPYRRYNRAYGKDTSVEVAVGQSLEQKAIAVLQIEIYFLEDLIRLDLRLHALLP